MSDTVSKYFESDPEVTYNEMKEDEIVNSVVRQFQERSKIGIKKYGTTLERSDLSLMDWFNHLQQELMDAALYVEKLKNEHQKN